MGAAADNFGSGRCWNPPSPTTGVTGSGGASGSGAGGSDARKGAALAKRASAVPPTTVVNERRSGRFTWLSCPDSVAAMPAGDPAGDGPAVSPQDLIRWSETLSGIARTGLGFTESLYERERFEEILKVAADMRVAAGHELESGPLVEEWLKIVGSGVPGYVTPKVAVGAVVGNEKGEILLVQRADSGVWLYPTGWADVGYSPSEVAVKEVEEETGIEVEPVRLIAVLDGLRLGFTRVPLYSLVFHCRVLGGELRRHELECADVGWFAEDSLPRPLAGADRWGPAAFAAIRGEPVEVTFDRPRRPAPWRSDRPE
jgi:ADP-ribose pyrophosphatase YjhB (NUDIX family)